LRATVWEKKFDNEMNIAMEKRKAICVHITRVQVPYLCFVIRMCSVSSLHSASLKFPDWDSGTCKFTLGSPLVPGSIPGNGYLKGVYLKLT
jgi:hypothetical protein